MTLLHLNMSDYIIILLYIAILGIISFLHRCKKVDTCEFLMAGRKLTLPLFIATLVSTFYGGIFGIAEFVASFGLGAWLAQGIFWYIVYFIFALFCAERVQKMKIYTIADILENHYGKPVAFCGGFFTYLMVNPAPYLFSLGLILQLFLDLTLWQAIILGTVITVFYTFIAGFRGVVYSDFIQCILMYSGFLVLFIMTIQYFGGFSFLKTHLSLLPGLEQHLTLTGGMSWGYLLVWAGMTCWIFVDPSFYQRCSAAQSPKIAKKGIFFSILLWATFDILSCSTALYAVAGSNSAWFPLQIATCGFSNNALTVGQCGVLSIPNSAMGHIVLADCVLSSPWKGFFLVAILSTIMSTADSYLFVASMNISQDYYWRFYNKNATSQEMIKVTRIGLLFTAFISCLLAICLPSVVDLWYSLGTVGLSALIIPILYTMITKNNDKKYTYSALYSMLSGFITSFFWLCYGRYYGSYPFECEPLYPGIFIAFVVFFSGIMIERCIKYYSK